jgi:hypothetical protein
VEAMTRRNKIRKNSEEDFRRQKREAYDPLRQLLHDARYGQISQNVIPLVNKLMSGDLTVKHITLAARLGHPEALTVCFYLGCGPVSLINWNSYDEYYATLRSMSQLLAKKPATRKKIIVRYACDLVERVLPIFENQYPDDPRPRQTIVATRKWIEGQMSSEEITDIANAAEAAHTDAIEASAAAQSVDAAQAELAADAIAFAVAGTAKVPNDGALNATAYAINAASFAVDASVYENEVDWQQNRLAEYVLKMI